MTALDVALHYAALGLAVFPLYTVRDGVCTCTAGRECGSNAGKHPRTTHGVKDATTARERITAWWTQMPDANIGIATGAVSGWDVLDVDPRHDGNETLFALEQQHSELPRTCTARTQSGGSHLFFKHADGIKNLVSLLGSGLDLKTTGGYVVAAPSVGKSGPYSWVKGLAPWETEPAAWPDWLLGLARSKNGASNGNGSGHAPPIADKIPQGERNRTLVSLAGSMRRRGCVFDEIFSLLKTVNTLRCDPPFTEQAIRKIAESICKYPPGQAPPSNGTTPKPRTPPRIIRGTELMLRTPIQQEFVVDQLLVRGTMAMVSGSPKAGKSVFSLEVAAAVADGVPFLDRFRTLPGGVLFWFADDPNEHKFVLDFQKLGMKHPENFTLWPERRQLDADGLADLDGLLGDLKPALTIIDNLTCIRPQRTGFVDVALADYNLSRLLLDCAVRHNTAMLVLHHKSTGRKGGDSFDAVAGSYGVSAGGGDSLLIDKPDLGRTERYVRGQGRNIEDVEFIYARGLDKKLFFVARGACCRYWSKLIYPLALRPDPSFEVADLSAEAGSGKRWAYAMLQDLRRCGAARALSGGRYSLDPDLIAAAQRVQKCSVPSA
jgi:hypothetical protein